MTDLQIALVALGAIIIVAVVFFNWWQERNLRNQMAQPFGEARHDPLMDEFRIDTDAIPEEKLERPIARMADPVDEVPFESPKPARQPYTAASTPIEEHPAYSDDINEAASALAEFEEDMAVPVVEEDVEALRQAYWEENAAIEDSEDAGDLAGNDELMEEAGLDEVEPAAAAMVATPKEIPLPTEVSQQIDLIAVLYLKNAAAGSALRDILLTLTDLDKSVYGYGLDAAGDWHMLTKEEENNTFKRVLCSLQLVDRGGAVTRESLKRFQQAVANMAQTLGATVEWQGDSDALGYATDLDRFCVDVDKLVGFHLIQGPNGPFTGTKLRGLAEAGGMTLHADGAFYHSGDNGQHQFAMVNQDGTPFTLESLRSALVRGVTFQLDIPHVAHCTEVFNQMVLAAKQMESSLGGQLVDANQRPLGEVQIEKIRQELKTIQAKMTARGILPGSLIAHRLFS